MEETHSELSLASILESLIFVSDGPASIEELARVLEQEPAVVEQALAELAGSYEGRGIRLQRTRDRLQLVSAPEAAAYVQKLLGLELSARLSLAGLETLAIIAYRQPITRPQIEMIRGVNSDGVIHNLLSRGLIEELGRLETVGHPIQYGTTFDFLQYFGLQSIEDLPPLPPDVNLQTDSRDVAELLRGREATMRPPEPAANWSEEVEREAMAGAAEKQERSLPSADNSNEEDLAVS
ncbi:MAG: SMC-Scp complex subunit ScpB [Rudaea sp.]